VLNFEMLFLSMQFQKVSVWGRDTSQPPFEFFPYVSISICYLLKGNSEEDLAVKSVDAS
jgi:hypothetical protein